ncbi:sugar transferase, partial [Clostridiaceae bacterium OM02-2AC]
EWQKHRHDVRPGLTGFAQVSGRNRVSWKERFRLDVDYVEKVSLLLDLKILFLTVKAVIYKDGITSDNSVTMEEFVGNKAEL